MHSVKRESLCRSSKMYVKDHILFRKADEDKGINFWSKCRLKHIDVTLRIHESYQLPLPASGGH